MSIYDQLKEKFVVGEWDGYTRKMIFAALGINSQSEKSMLGRILAELQLHGVIYYIDGKYCTP